MARAAWGGDVARLKIDGDRRVTGRELRSFDELLDRRCRREPLQLIVGTAPFIDMELDVWPGVFVPRFETEGLASAAAELMTAYGGRTVLELCAGTAPAALYLARRFPAARVTAVEIDDRACALARHNAAKLGVKLEVRRGDVLHKTAWRSLPVADVIVANPPYIPTEDLKTLMPEVRDWDPRRALDGGDDGLTFYPPLVELASARLAAGGWVVLEIHEERSAQVRALLRTWRDVAVRRDLGGRDRYVLARKKD